MNQTTICYTKFCSQFIWINTKSRTKLIYMTCCIYFSETFMYLSLEEKLLTYHVAITWVLLTYWNNNCILENSIDPFPWVFWTPKLCCLLARVRFHGYWCLHDQSACCDSFHSRILSIFITEWTIYEQVLILQL